MNSQSKQDERRRGQFREMILAVFHERAERVAELKAEIGERNEQLRSAMLEIGPSEMGCGGRLATLQVEVVRQAARIAALEAMLSEHEEHLRLAMLGIGGADEAPCSRCLPLQTEVVRQAARIAELEEMTPESRLDYDEEKG